jgi:hypothetical protein
MTTLPVQVTGIEVMGDETLMLHLELRHRNDLSLEFVVDPDRPERRLHASAEWRTFHNTMHRLQPNSYDHLHTEESHA